MNIILLILLIVGSVIGFRKFLFAYDRNKGKLVEHALKGDIEEKYLRSGKESDYQVVYRDKNNFIRGSLIRATNLDHAQYLFASTTGESLLRIRSIKRIEQ